MKEVIIIDTSILCVWLQLPGFNSVGSQADNWDYERINGEIETERALKTTLVLPLATIIETGNHISQSSGDTYEIAQRFCQILENSIDNEDPWAAFSEQGELWAEDSLRRLAKDWPALCAKRLSPGDATIVEVAKYYAKAGFLVEIFTGDAGLRAYTPQTVEPRLIPRRKRL